MQVTLNKGDHFCVSTTRVRTKMASFHWVAEKAIPFLKKDGLLPNEMKPLGFGKIIRNDSPCQPNPSSFDPET